MTATPPDVKRVAVVHGVSSLCMGSMPAAVGMKTRGSGTIARVNAKSVVVVPSPGSGRNFSPWRRTDTLYITIAEARRFGWPTAAGSKVFEGFSSYTPPEAR